MSKANHGQPACKLNSLLAGAKQIQVSSGHKNPSCPALFFSTEALGLPNRPRVDQPGAPCLLRWWLGLLRLSSCHLQAIGEGECSSWSRRRILRCHGRCFPPPSMGIDAVLPATLCGLTYGASSTQAPLPCSGQTPFSQPEWSRVSGQ